MDERTRALERRWHEEGTLAAAEALDVECRRAGYMSEPRCLALKLLCNVILNQPVRIRLWYQSSHEAAWVHGHTPEHLMRQTMVVLDERILVPPLDARVLINPTPYQLTGDYAVQAGTGFLEIVFRSHLAVMPDQLVEVEIVPGPAPPDEPPSYGGFHREATIEEFQDRYERLAGLSPRQRRPDRDPRRQAIDDASFETLVELGICPTCGENPVGEGQCEEDKLEHVGDETHDPLMCPCCASCRAECHSMAGPF